MEMARNTLYNWCEKGNIPLDKLILLGEAGVDVHYVVFGKSSGAQNIERNNVQNSEQDREAAFNSTFVLIPVYDVEVSAGHGAVAYGATEISNTLAFRKDWIASRGFTNKELHIVIARGDSMSPTINDGEYVLVNTIEKYPRDGHIYVIRNGDMIWVKRVQRLIESSLLLISDNVAYPPMQLNLDTANDVEVIGKVVNSSRNFY
jgi:phage repressor protein C with HTH and peptisase S24 domain